MFLNLRRTTYDRVALHAFLSNRLGTSYHMEVSQGIFLGTHRFHGEKKRDPSLPGEHKGGAMENLPSVMRGDHTTEP